MLLVSAFLENDPYILKCFEESMFSREKNRRQTTWLCRPLSDFHRSAWDNGKVEHPDPVVVNAERIGTYTKLPAEYPLIISTGRSPDAVRELNNQWFTVGKGSEHTGKGTEHVSQKYMRNSYEDALLRCEDERFELDVAISSFASCVDYLNRVQTEYQEAIEKGERYEIKEDSMRNPKMKPVFRMYGDSAQIMLEKFEADPVQVIPVLLYRLDMENDMLARKKVEQNKIWKEICEKNYHKSLDHKAVHFKQAERKETNNKGTI